MAASMGATVLSVGLVGDENGELANSIGSQLDIVPYQGSGSGLAAVIVDGAGGGSLPQDLDLRQLLDTTNVLALASPSAAMIQAVDQTTGLNTTGQSDLVFYIKDAGGHYQILQLSRSIDQAGGHHVQGGPVPVAPTVDVPLGATLADVLNGLSKRLGVSVKQSAQRPTLRTTCLLLCMGCSSCWVLGPVALPIYRILSLCDTT